LQIKASYFSQPFWYSFGESTPRCSAALGEYIRQNIATMASSATTETSVVLHLFTARHQDALALELSLLKATLQRNGSAHKRARYFRYLQLAHRYCSCTAATLFDDLNAFLFDKIEALQQEMKNEAKRTEQRKKKREIFWELKTDPKRRRDTSSAKEASRAKSEQALVEEITALAESLAERTASISRQCLPRIELAAQVAFQEIGRGFFLPFLTVTTGCIGRIRILLLKLQMHIRTELVRTMPRIQRKEDGTVWISDTTRLMVEDLIEGIAKSNQSVRPPKKAELSKKEITDAALKSLGIVLAPPAAAAAAGSSSQGALDRGDAGFVVDNQSSLLLLSDPTETLDRDFAAGYDKNNNNNNATDDGTALDDEIDNTATDADPTTAAIADNRKMSAEDAPDVGESVDHGLFAAATPRRDHPSSSRQPSYLSAAVALSEALLRSDDGIDQNEEALERLRQSKRKKRNSEEEAKKAKRKKKKKDGDFFDELFG
jgi:hypothetical protein